MRMLLASLLFALPVAVQDPTEPPAQKVRTVLGMRLAAADEDPVRRPGLRLVAVEKGSPAQRAGLRAGDVLIRAGGAVLGTSDDLTSRLRGLAPGDRIVVDWFRRVDGTWSEVSGRLTIPEPSAVDTVRVALGLELAILESKIRRRIISTDTPYGFKIARVVKGSAADDLGLKPGHILMKWDGKPIHEVDQLARWIRQSERGSTVTIEVTRRKKNIGILARDRWESVDLELTLPGKK